MRRMTKKMAFTQSLIDEHAPGAECIEAMKVWKIPEGREYKFAEVANSGDYFAQLKKDGYWYQFEKTDNGDNYLFSRTISKTTGILTEKGANVPHIMEALDIIPKGTILVGEIYYPNKTSKSVTRIMGCLPDKAIQRQEEQGYIHYYVHDIIKYKGESLMDKGAWERYEKLIDLWNECGLANYEAYLELAEVYTKNIQEETAAALERGEEGMVLKKKDCPYTPGKRPAWHNLKIKKIDYLDAVCMGFCDPTKEYTGKEVETWPLWIKEEPNGIDYQLSLSSQFGVEGWTPVTKGYAYHWKTAIRVGAYDDNGNLKEIGTVASGLTDELRAKFGDETLQHLYIGKVVKLQCMELDKKEQTLRHAFFKGFRDDKDAKDCKISEIFA